MKFIIITVSLLFLFSNTSKAQKFGRNSLVFFRVAQESVGRNQAIPAGTYKFKKKLYVIGAVKSQYKGNGVVTIEPKYYLYSCSDTSETWIRTNKVTIEKRLRNNDLVATEVWDTKSIPEYNKQPHLVRPLSTEVITILTRNKITSSTDSCPTITAKNSALYSK